MQTLGPETEEICFLIFCINIIYTVLHTMEVAPCSYIRRCRTKIKSNIFFLSFFGGGGGHKIYKFSLGCEIKSLHVYL